MHHYIIVSGVPASGKSTVARLIAQEIALDLTYQN
jgi:cytidylate kinase